MYFNSSSLTNIAHRTYRWVRNVVPSENVKNKTFLGQNLEKFDINDKYFVIKPKLFPNSLNCFKCALRFFSTSETSGSSKPNESNMKDSPIRKTLTKQEIKNFQGNYQRYKRNAGLPEFHNVDLDKHGCIIQPTDRFMLVLTTSKNNVHAQLVNRSKNYKTIFGSFAGNVGYRKKMQQTDKCAYRIGENIARKCKRLGVFAVDVKFRRISRVESVLQALHALGLQVGQLIHEPRLPKTGINSVRPRKRRRV